MIASDQLLVPEKRLGISCIHRGDALEGLKEVASGTVRLVITSPPYNIGKPYERRQALELYQKGMADIIDECVRALSPAGSLCWQVGVHVDGATVLPLDYLFHPMFEARGLQLRNRIIWHYRHGFNPRNRFSGRYETLLWYTKGDDYTFNLDAVRVPQRYPGKRSYKGKNKGKPSGNPNGKNPSDVWEIQRRDWEVGIFDLPNVKSGHVEKTAHPCQFPIEIAERCILALSDEGDLVVDPYCGVGSSLVAAAMHRRRSIGCEQNSEYVELAYSRMKQLAEGTLRYRPLGKEVQMCGGRVASPPDEWKDLSPLIAQESIGSLLDEPKRPSTT